MSYLLFSLLVIIAPQGWRGGRAEGEGEGGRAEGSRGRRPLASDARCRAGIATAGSVSRTTPSKGAREPRRGTRRRGLFFVGFCFCFLGLYFHPHQGVAGGQAPLGAGFLGVDSLRGHAPAVDAL